MSTEILREFIEITGVGELCELCELCERNPKLAKLCINKLVELTNERISNITATKISKEDIVPTPVDTNPSKKRKTAAKQNTTTPKRQPKTRKCKLQREEEELFSEHESSDNDDSSTCSDATVKTENGEHFADDSDGSGYGGNEDSIRFSDVVQKYFKEYSSVLTPVDYQSIGKIMTNKYKEYYGLDDDPIKRSVIIRGKKVHINAYHEQDIELMKQSIEQYIPKIRYKIKIKN